MNKKIVLGVIIVLGLVIALIIVRQRMGQTRLTPAMKEELGAATLVSADHSLYAAYNQPAPHMRRIWESNAMQKLLQLPTLQQGLMFLKANPSYVEIKNQVTKHPLFIAAAPVAKDAVEDEMFICADQRLPGFLAAINALTNAFRVAQLTQVGEAAAPNDKELTVNAKKKAFLSQEDNLEIPGLLFGAKLTDSARAAKLVDQLVAALPPEMSEYTGEQKVDGNVFTVIELHGKDIPEKELEEGLADLNDPEAAKLIKEWLLKQRIIVAAGVKKNYLLLSLGADLAPVKRFAVAVDQSLAASQSFEPLRQRFKPGLWQTAYLSAPLMKNLSWKRDLDDMPEMAAQMIEALPKNETIDEELKTRLKKDAVAFTDDLRKFAGPAAPFLRFSFENNGIETFQITQPGRINPRTLSILKYRGADPAFVCAGSSPECADLYDTAAKWLKVGFDYFDTLAVPEMQDKEREEYRNWRQVILPYLRKMHEITSTQLIPAADGVQSMLVADDKGELQGTAIQANKSNAIPLMRLGLVVELNDAETFKKAMQDYYNATHDLVEQIKDEELVGEEVTGFSLPPIQKTGDLYHYDYPWKLGDDVFPCARFNENMLFVCSAKDMGANLLQEKPMPQSEVVDLTGPAASVTVVQLRKVWDYLLSLNEAVVAETASRDDLNQGANYAIGLTRFHLDTIYQSLSAMRSFIKTTKVDQDGWVVKHSWLQVEDID